jgi:formylglycine-generating enzyme required for sulfatase activity
LLHEQPERAIDLAAFSIDRTEVTNARYRACADAGACPPQDFARCETFDYPDLQNGVPETHELRAPEHPAVCVSYAQAAAYCRFAGGRLPSEEEWERAARGTSDHLFPWGDRWDETKLNWGDGGEVDGFVITSPAGAFPGGATAEGVLDLAGNVWEWTASEYSDGKRRVTRGGGFAANPIAFTTTHRAPQDPARVVINIGFRCAAD